MTTTSSAQQWIDSSAYKNLFDDVTATDAQAFLQTLTAHIKSTGRLLHTACGNGELTRQITSEGLDVTGTDLSTTKIAEALPYASDQLHFYMHDLRLPFWSNYFNVALSLFTSFGGYRTVREHENVIRTIASSLLPGGVFVLDYLNATAEAKRPGVDATSIADRFSRSSTVGDDSPTGSITITETRMAFSLAELTDIFRQHSLEVRKLYGDYNLGEYAEASSSRLIIEAVKQVGSTEDKEKRIYSDGRTGDALT